VTPDRNDATADEVVRAVFARLRQNGVALGVGEVLAALQAARGDWRGAGADSAADPATLKQLLTLLWCHSPAEARELDLVWSLVSPTLLPVLPNRGTELTDEDQVPPPLPRDLDRPLTLPPPTITGPSTRTGDDALLSALPVRAPFLPARDEATGPAAASDPTRLRAYGPVSRRFLAYGWRRLRRLVADGPADLLDVNETVRQTARLGVYRGPVFRRRARNAARLLLLLDQNGSMTPFHRLGRDLIESAQTDGALAGVNVFFFHDVPSQMLYADPHLTRPAEREAVLAGDCDADTSVLIVSDAGAARGETVQRERVRATAGALQRIRRSTVLLAWLNPLPDARWTGTTAEYVSRLVPQFALNEDGFSRAIDVVRGQPLPAAGGR